MSTAQRRPQIFTEADLELYGFSCEVGETEILSGLARLSRLRDRFQSGLWPALTESNVEQSFVERVFGDIFGYQTLLCERSLSDTETAVHAIPKLYVPIASGGRAFPDLSLGHFRADSMQTVICAEFKGPGTKLDVAQTSGRHKGISPVEQGMSAAIAAGAVWCIVSNTHEVRLYRAPSIDAYEIVNLLDIESPLQFRHAFALLSRRSLLRGTELSPLSVLYDHLQQGESMLIPNRDGCIRLYQRARVLDQHREVSFARLSKALRCGLQKIPQLNGGVQDVIHPRLEGDQLAIDIEGPGARSRIATNRSGLLVCSTTIPTTIIGQSGDCEKLLDSMNVLEQFALMILFAKLFYRTALDGTLRVSIEWGMEDLGGHVGALAQKWTSPSSSVHLTCQPNVSRVSTPSIECPVPIWIGQDEVSKVLTEALTEVFFPFEGRDAFGQVCRLEPTVHDVSKFLESRDCLRNFGYHEHGRWVDPLCDSV